MKIRVIGLNQLEVQTRKGLFFVSYETPVCIEKCGSIYSTDQKHSSTTSKHINKWLKGRHADPISQEGLDALWEEV